MNPLAARGPGVRLDLDKSTYRLVHADEDMGYGLVGPTSGRESPGRPSRQAAMTLGVFAPMLLGGPALLGTPS
jgi:hypothetical protein